jgi:hypothetical protein
VLSEDNVVLLTDSDEGRLASLTAAGAYVSRTSHPPSTAARPKAPGEDVPLLCGPLIAGEGPVKPVAGSQRTGPSTARKGNPQVASVACLVPTGDPSLLRPVERSIRAGG